MCIATREIMDCMFEAYLEATIEPDDIPQTSEPVFILGKKYIVAEGTNKTNKKTDLNSLPRRYQCYPPGRGV